MTLHLVVISLGIRGHGPTYEAMELDEHKDGDWGECFEWYVVNAKNEKHACTIVRLIKAKE